ncbi:putative serine/threonine-protein phosphatase 2A regulatory subunit B'' subunit TON2 [Gossypium australe]|uniref:Putative serine/threonine-protein phosphatase 2A regulatory subunit B'' subunit TON2 n=1 Tax=Gossypium australe TaxID=47621 RepID=A0A5B6UJ00_9ROSI|nr:putative serine/threonine-protein phosphatase 2A regulatory subunit B'' subunit TON2 [Gossypium australe]
MYGGSSEGDGHKAATQRKIPPASFDALGPRTFLGTSEPEKQLSPGINGNYIRDSHRKWIEGGDYGLCIEDVRDEIWDMVKPVDLH